MTKPRHLILIGCLIIIVLIEVLSWIASNNEIEYSGYSKSIDKRYQASFSSYYDETPLCVSQTDVFLQRTSYLNRHKGTILRLTYPADVFFDWKAPDHLDLIIPINRKALIDDIKYNNTGMKEFNHWVLRFVPKYEDVSITIYGEAYPEKTGEINPQNCGYLNTDVFGAGM